jgi:hypothetical protein
MIREEIKKVQQDFLRDIHPIYEDLRLYKQTESQ